jgi:PAS domain S-box-containing protein
MSVVTNQPEMHTSVPSTSNARLRASGPHDYPCDSAGVFGNRRIERRRNGRSGGSPMDILTRLPAVVVLERLPVPALAMTRDGIILFVNTAFAQMVGYRQDKLTGLAFPEVFHTVPAALCALSAVDALANLVLELRHCEGWTVRARMSKSALMRRDDPVVLVTFEDLTERLWDDEK